MGDRFCFCWGNADGVGYGEIEGENVFDIARVVFQLELGSGVSADQVNGSHGGRESLTRPW